MWSRWRRPNTLLGNVKRTIDGTCHACAARYAGRYLAEFAYRFDRRHELAGLVPRLVDFAVCTSPPPDRLLTRAEPAGYSGGPMIGCVAFMTIKSTYSLDVGTVRTLERLARRWNVSKCEALRRAIRNESERQASRADARLQALRALQESIADRDVDLDAWEHEAREIRSASVGRLTDEPR